MLEHRGIVVYRELELENPGIKAVITHIRSLARVCVLSFHKYVGFGPNGRLVCATGVIIDHTSSPSRRPQYCVHPMRPCGEDISLYVVRYEREKVTYLVTISRM